MYATPGAEVPGLSIVSVVDGRTRRLATPGAAHAPAWSPREDIIAYLQPDPRVARSRGLSPATGSHAMLGVPDVPDQFGNGRVSWSSDGGRLAVAGLPGARAGYIWIFRAAPTTPPRKLLDLPAGVYLRGIAWSRDGSSLDSRSCPVVE